MAPTKLLKAPTKLLKAKLLKAKIKNVLLSFSVDMKIPCPRTFLIPRIRILFKFVQGHRRFSNRRQGSLVESKTTGAHGARG